MKIYRGMRVGVNETVFEVLERAERAPGRSETITRPLEHRVQHSPTGMEWGYAGSGPSDLARSILWDLTGGRVDAQVYQRFKFLAIATLNRENGFELAEDTVRLLLEQIQRETGIRCLRCGDHGYTWTDDTTAIAAACDACDKGRDVAREWKDQFGNDEPEPHA